MKITKSIGTLLAAATLAGVMLAVPPVQAHAAVVVAVGIAPPAIPVYEQPLIPGDGYIWTPGYWAYGDAGYYWVDGAWVYPPYVGALWTPGWWGWGEGGYFWHAGLGGRSIGYYGGINYGFGYFGVGFYGGYWNGGRFFYNRAYGNFGPGFHGAFYNHPYAGFNGRPGGASFNAHPPAQYAGVNRGNVYAHGSSINGSYHGPATDGYRGGAPAYNRSAPQQSYANHSAPQQSYSNHSAPQSYGGSRAPSAPAGRPSGGGAISHGGAHGGGHR